MELWCRVCSTSRYIISLIAHPKIYYCTPAIAKPHTTPQILRPAAETNTPPSPAASYNYICTSTPRRSPASTTTTCALPSSQQHRKRGSLSAHPHTAITYSGNGAPPNRRTGGAGRAPSHAFEEPAPAVRGPGDAGAGSVFCACARALRGGD